MGHDMLAELKKYDVSVVHLIGAKPNRNSELSIAISQGAVSTDQLSRMEIYSSGFGAATVGGTLGMEPAGEIELHIPVPIRDCESDAPISKDDDVIFFDIEAKFDSSLPTTDGIRV
ncbi:hypothetical protein N7492_007855 [Penicillium capsulatum]|uniref:Uncharacterized protein n=1 Tax=Penicillium capsulatum TaxID=69766 RepID=A0A9W9I2W4_9EURO|nr:hypothetical protein N7492_007855 [Penicillium capsulatum]KAJ6117686.1 hypothetical protein N7512_007411 [Penicillium capsulatum]